MRPRLDHPRRADLAPRPADGVGAGGSRAHPQQGRSGSHSSIVEHRLELLTPIADRIVVMDRGRKVMEGKPAEVLTDPQAAGYGISQCRPSRSSTRTSRGTGSLSGVSPTHPDELAEEVNGALSLIEFKDVTFVHQNGVTALEGRQPLRREGRARRDSGRERRGKDHAGQAHQRAAQADIRLRDRRREEHAGRQHRGPGAERRA